MGFVVNMDFTTIEPNQGGASYLPVSDSRGWLVQIIDSGQQENSKKDGMVAKFVIQGMEGAAQGRTCEHYVNLANPNQKAVEIGMGELSAIGHAIGHVRLGNSTEWHNRPLRAVVVADPSEQYPNRTRIQKFLDANGNAPGKGPQTAGGTQQAGNFAGNPAQGQPASGGAQQGFGNGQPAQGGNFGGGAAQGGGFQPQQGGAQQPQGGGFQATGQGFQPQQGPQQGGGFQQGGGQGFNPGAQTGGPGWGNGQGQ